jgi:hypothetical protein
MMLQLTLAYVIQADQEREVAEDLRNRQWLRTPERRRTAVQPTWRRAADPRRMPIRARGTGV